MNIENNHCDFSPCRRYRYTLWRVWGDKPFCMFIGLNPSVADEKINDNTVRRCINYSKDWGYGALCMTNIFAYRDTNPDVMKSQLDPIGPENNKYLLEVSKSAGVIVGAWGNHGEFMNRGLEVIKLIPNLHCLKITNKGHPQHPLYLKKTLTPIKYDRI